MLNALTEKERRRHKRYDRCINVSLYGEDRDIVDERPTVNNVSSGGFQFETVTRISPDEPLRFDMYVPGKGLIEGKAVLRWTRVSDSGLTYVCGAEIRNLSWADSRALKQFLEPGMKWTALIDAIFGLGMAYSIFLISQQIKGNEAAFFSHLVAAAGDAIDWAPQLSISAGAALAIWLYFKDR